MAESREGRTDVLAPGAAWDGHLGCHKWINVVSILYPDGRQMWDFFFFYGNWICFPCDQLKIYVSSLKYYQKGQAGTHLSLPGPDSMNSPQANAFYALSPTPTSCFHPLTKSPLPSFALFPGSRAQKISAISEQCGWGLCALSCISIGSRHICLHSRRTALQSAKIKPQKIKRKAS